MTDSILDMWKQYSENPESKYGAPVYSNTGGSLSPIGNQLYDTPEKSNFWYDLLKTGVNTAATVYTMKKANEYGQTPLFASPMQPPTFVQPEVNPGTVQTGLPMPNSVGSFTSGINPTFLIVAALLVAVFVLRRG